MYPPPHPSGSFLACHLPPRGKALPLRKSAALPLRRRDRGRRRVSGGRKGCRARAAPAFTTLPNREPAKRRSLFGGQSQGGRENPLTSSCPTRGGRAHFAIRKKHFANGKVLFSERFQSAGAMTCAMRPSSASLPAPVVPEQAMTFPSPSPKASATARVRSFVFMRESLSHLVAMTVNGMP